METEKKRGMMDLFVELRGPRQTSKVEHNLGERRAVAICAVLAGADDLVEIEEWAKEKRDWFRRYSTLENGIPSHDVLSQAGIRL